MSELYRKPPVWLLAFIAFLPQLTETIYSPTLTEIAHEYGVASYLIELTITIFFIGFAFGGLMWGKLSDYYGRKKILLISLIVYMVGCVLCFYASNIYELFFARIMQALGAGSGSIVGQTISRDSFSGKELAKVYSIVMAALASSPAFGPVLGGVIAEHLKWQYVFVVLMLLAVGQWLLILLFLPETNHHIGLSKSNLRLVAGRMLKDRVVVINCLLIALCNGLLFGYLAEGPFFMIEMLGMSPSRYGLTFLIVALAVLAGGVISHRMQPHFSHQQIMTIATKMLATVSLLFSSVVLLSSYYVWMHGFLLECTLLSMVVVSVSNSIIIPNSMSKALAHYRESVGTASALLAFAYYILIAGLTGIMAAIHNGTIYPMPLYFTCICIVMYLLVRLEASQEVYEESASTNAPSA
jgi:DHA1 family bicyclomycin/chloramphenicol resistance-like MFS transporter